MYTEKEQAKTGTAHGQLRDRFIDKISVGTIITTLSFDEELIRKKILKDIKEGELNPIPL